jgi:hypothetical protein
LGIGSWSAFEKPKVTSVLVFLVGLAILSAVTIAWGPSKALHADSEQYMAIGSSLAAGNGFKNPVGPWPDRAEYARMPGWPALISVGLRVAPWAKPEAVSRFTNAFCLSVAAAFFCGLSRRLGVKPIFSVLAGLAVALSPSLVYLSVDGLSEVSFLMIIAIGLTAVLAGGRWIYPGAFILGLAALVRTNFILVPFVFVGLALGFPSARETLLKRWNPIRVFACCVLALAPVLLWAVRNDLITGRFPMLSTIEGETFYGSNNDLVAHNLEYWGYWAFPDDIPGEVPKLELAKRLGNDLALNDYYHRKGVAWVKANLRSLPRLELGKFIRAFAPIPWAPLTASYVAFFCRFLLYVGWLALLPFWWRGMNRTYLLFCLAMAVVHVITTAMYYGLYRFTHCYVEILFVPCIAYGLQQWLASTRSSHFFGKNDRDDAMPLFENGLTQ